MASGKWHIRKAGIVDLAAIVRLEASNASLAWSAGAIEKDILENPRGFSLAAILGTDLAGYIACWFVIDEAQIMTLTVDKNWRRLGIGLSLLDSLEDEARSRNISRIILEVRSKNLAARSLYKRAGFAEISSRPGYYADTGEDAIIMLKIISDNG